METLVYTDVSRGRMVVVPPARWIRADAAEAIADVGRQMGTKKWHFIGDCRRMESYEGAVRLEWQTFFRSARPQILSFVFVGVKSRLVRMGISTMSMLLSLPMDSVDRLEGLRPIPADDRAVREAGLG